MSVRLAHLSDPHFGSERITVMCELCRTLKRLAPDLIVLSGDITQRARRSQFIAARRFLANLRPTPVLVVPGNHDIPLFNVLARWRWPYRKYQRVLGAALAPDVSLHGVRLIGFNSAPPWRHKYGELDSSHVARQLTTLNGAAPLRVAVLHHPLDCRSPSDERNLLLLGQRLLQVFSDHDVDLVLGGHIHDPFVTLSSRRYPQLRRPMILAVAGTCVSQRTRPEIPNSFNFITLEPSEPATQTLERWDMAGGEFESVACNRFIREPGTGWLPLH